MLGKVGVIGLMLSVALLAPERATALDIQANVSFSCESVPGAASNIFVEGAFQAPPAGFDMSNPFPTQGYVQVRVVGLGGETAFLSGNLMGASNLVEPSTGGILFVPMRVFLDGRMPNGRYVNGSFYFGHAEESVLMLDRSPSRLYCSFVPGRVTPSESGPTPLPRPDIKPCREVCHRFSIGHAGPTVRCTRVCDGRPTPRHPRGQGH